MPQRLTGLFPPFRFDFHRAYYCRSHRLQRMADDLPEDVFEDWMAAASDVPASA